MQNYSDIRSRGYGFSEIQEKTLGGVFGPWLWEILLPTASVTFLGFAVAQIRAVAQWERIERNLGAFSQGTANPTALLKEFIPEFAIGGAFLFFALVVAHYVLHRIRTLIGTNGERRGEALRRALDPFRLAAFITSIVVATVLVTVGTVLFVVPGMALSVVLVLLPACVVNSESRFRVPLREPFRIIKGRFWQTAGILVVLWLPFAVAAMVLSVPSTLLMPQVPGLAELDDVSGLMRAAHEWNTSATAIVIGLLGNLIGAAYFNTTGFATMVMCTNYRAVPWSPDASETEKAGRADQDALRGIYEREHLEEQPDLDSVPAEVGHYGEIDYATWSGAALIQTYHEMDHSRHPKFSRALLGEIKRRQESGGAPRRLGGAAQNDRLR